MIIINISAIVAEYNPLHKGHLYQINKTKEMAKCDALICIISGNFVQRGEPAIIDKWSRTKMALESGIDLVLELPVIYSLSSAEFFAQGAISILDKLKVVNNLCFGSECGDVHILDFIAKILVDEPQEYKEILKYYLSTGMTYPLARSKALYQYSEEFTTTKIAEELLNCSNNILGIEYCKSILKTKSLINPYSIKRVGGSYNSKDLNESFSSATAIRELIKNNSDLTKLEKQLPSHSFAILKECLLTNSFTLPEAMFSYMKYKLLTDPYSLTNLPDIREGLNNRILSSINNAQDYEHFLNTIKTKRYTYTRIARCLCQYFIGFDQYNTELMRKSSPEYVRILGFNSKGAEILKLAKKVCDIELITKLRKNTNPMLELDILSTKMYSLLNKSISLDSDFKKGPIIYNLF